MRGSQVFSAFLLASMVMFGMLYGYWTYSVNQFVGRVDAKLSEVMPGQFKIGSVEESFDLFKTRLTLRNSKLNIVDAKRGSSVIISLGDVVLEKDHFENKRFDVTLPERVSVVTTLKNRTEDYRLTLLEPNLEIKKVDGVFYTVFSANGLILQGRENGYFRNLAKMGYGYISKDNSSKEWSMVANNVDLANLETFETTPVISSVGMTWKNRSGYKPPVSYMLSAWGTKNNQVSDSMGMDVLKHMASYFRIDVEEGRLMFENEWYSYSGEVGVNDQLSLDVRGSLTSNRFAKMIKLIKTEVGDFPLALERMMDRIGGADNNVTQSINVSARNRIFSINGAPIGKMDTLPEILHLGGRGVR